MMKKNESNFVKVYIFAEKLFSKIKNSFKKPSKEAFGKIGLFLIFGMITLNLNFTQDKNESLSLKVPMAEAGIAEWWEEYKERRSIGGDLYGGTAHLGAEAGSKAAQEPNNDTNTFEVLANGVLLAMSKLLQVAGGLVDMMLTQEYFDALLRSENNSIYRGWTIIRDFLNMFFMLLLLFSAFATIFQVEKYHLKKSIIMLVVMALLVNFSYAITLFVIDLSNSAMYFLVDNAFNVDSASPSAQINRFTRFADAVYASTSLEASNFEAIILNIIFAFIAFITLFAIGLNLLIRMILFVILLIFAPAGFVFAFFPDTRNIANDWWSALFKYAFLGPIMVFFLFFGVMMFDIEGLAEVSDFKEGIIRFMIPTVFLWIGLMASSRFGGSGADAAMGMAKKVGNNIKTYGQKAAWGTIVATGAATGVPGAFKQRYADIKGGFDKSRENREARVASMLGSSDAMSNLERKRYEEDSKKMKNFNNSDLEAKAKAGNVAAADELLNRKSLKQEVYEEAIKNSKDTKRNDDLTAKFKGANKENRMDIVASIDARRNANDETKIAPLVSGGSTRDDAMKKLLEDEIRSKFTKLNHNDFAKQDFEKIYAEIGNKLGSATGSLEHHEGMVMRDAIFQAFSGLDPTGQDEVRRNLSASQLTALGRAGVV